MDHRYSMPRASGIALRSVRLGLVTCVVASACARQETACDGPETARGSGPWRLAVRAPDSARRGEPVPLVLVLRNVGSRAVDPQVGGPPAADFVVTRPGSPDEVWSALHRAQILSAVLRKGVIGSGDSLRINGQWDQVDNDRRPVPRGVYCIRGYLREHGLDSLRSDVAKLRVVP